MTRPRTFAVRAPRLVTLPTCPSCGALLRPKRIRVDRERDAIRVLACNCGHQEGHEVERQAVPA